MKLASGAGERAHGELGGPADATRPLELVVADGASEPYREKRYELAVMGREYRGTTSADGRISERIPADATQASVTVWLGQPPAGAAERWTLELRELPPAATFAGAMQRLRNMGYHPGVVGDEPDTATREAVGRFQHDHELPVTGELDDATGDKVAEVHGA
ncbi:MAG: peptidoglycan-binding protein [Myxococcales bacterium]|nr:peptidoglycan-binding protein [Myxococcales bacterium]